MTRLRILWLAFVDWLTASDELCPACQSVLSDCDSCGRIGSGL